MEWAEGLLYAVVGIVLVGSAAVALGAIGYDLVTAIDEGALDAVAAALDGLLLVFILVELLGAVRATVAERQLVAEPFLDRRHHRLDQGDRGRLARDRRRSRARRSTTPC